MNFSSILFPDGATPGDVPEPAYFRDLHLDQIADNIAEHEKEYDVRPYFRHALSDANSILYRQEAVRDLRREDVMRLVRAFCERMETMRRQLSQRDKLHAELQKWRWLLHAVETYCSAVLDLTAELQRSELTSRAFGSLRDFMAAHVVSETFQALLAKSQPLVSRLAEIRYCVLVGSGFVTVSPYESQPDYSTLVAETFERFHRTEAKNYRLTLNEYPHMNHVEESILDFVAKLHAEVFDDLRSFASANEAFADPAITRFDAEVRFYAAYLDHIASFEESGLSFCLPELAVTDKRVGACATFDLALANNLAHTNTPVVVNDFELRDGERIFIVSGPNQGGKTTFARTFGQLHHLACLGLPVPGTSARLLVFDRLFTHFEREENPDLLRGKLQDDLVRIHDILDSSTSRSVVIINEIFNSTTLADATFIATKVFERLSELGAVCVCVTFLVDLTRLSDTVVSLVSEVLKDRHDVRTFKVVRATADGRSYAESIAEEYRLTYDMLKARLST